MRPGGGKAKGAEFERQVCKSLSLWVSHGRREDLFWRSAMSGGRATVARRRGAVLAKQAGDISAVDPLGHQLTDLFYVECKFVKNFGLGGWVQQRPSVLRGFWDVAVTEAAQHRLKPMIIGKQNGGPILVVLPLTLAQQYSWARRNIIAQLKDGPNSFAAVLDFEAVLAQRFNARKR